MAINIFQGVYIALEIDNGQGRKSLEERTEKAGIEVLLVTVLVKVQEKSRNAFS